MSADRRLVLLDARFPNLSRMTLFRISREAGFPAPFVIRGRRYYDSAELELWEEAHRRLGKATTKRTAEVEAP
jgi:hypothetical protein